jgi:hypothetical protein
VSGVDGKRGQDGEDLFLEHGVEILAVFRSQSVVRRELDPLVGQGRAELIHEEMIDLAVEFDDPLPDRHELLPGRQPIRTRLRDPAGSLFEETGDTYLMELIQVRRHDRNELDPFEEWATRCGGKSEHSRLEFEERKLTVDV